MLKVITVQCQLRVVGELGVGGGGGGAFLKFIKGNIQNVISSHINFDDFAMPVNRSFPCEFTTVATHRKMFSPTGFFASPVQTCRLCK